MDLSVAGFISDMDSSKVSQLLNLSQLCSRIEAEAQAWTHSRLSPSAKHLLMDAAVDHRLM